MNKFKLLAIPVVMIATVLFLQSFRSDKSTMDVKEFEISAFTEIAIDGSLNVEYTQSEVVSAKLEASAEDLEHLTLEVKNETLRVKYEEKRNYKSVKLYVSGPHLKTVSIAGSGNFKGMNTITEPVIEFSIAGSGNSQATVQSDEVKTDIAGSGNVNLDGNTKKLKIDIAGSGNVKSNGCNADVIKVSIAGSGSAYVKSNGELSVSVAGSGSVYYTGDPKSVKQDISGSGTVKRKDS